MDDNKMDDVKLVDIDNRVFVIPNCGAGWIYHYIIYMFGRLYDIPKNAYIDSQNNKRKPKYHMENIKYEGIYKEVIEYVSDTYEYVVDLQKYIVNNPETKCVRLDPCSWFQEFIHPILGNCHIKMNGYPFLRKLLLKDYKQPLEVSKRYYITRKDSHLIDGNRDDNTVKRRQIINDEEFYNSLKEYGFEYIQLENYSIEDKVRIFSEAEIIVSPNSGGLTFALCANRKTKIVEINTPNPHQYNKQFIEICFGLNIKHIHYQSTKVDYLDNMTINIDDFIDKMKKSKVLESIDNQTNNQIEMNNLNINNDDNNDNPIRICINYWGQPRNRESHARDIYNSRIIHPNSNENNYEFHIVYSTWKDENIETFKKLFPEAYIKQYDKPDMGQYKNIIDNYKLDKSQPSSKSLERYLYGLYIKKLSTETIIKYQEQKKIKFDIVVSLRVDCNIWDGNVFDHYNNILKLNKINVNNNEIYFANENRYDIYNQGGVPDTLLLGNLNNVLLASKQIDIIEKTTLTNTKEIHPETAFFKGCIASGLNVKYLPFKAFPKQH